MAIWGRQVCRSYYGAATERRFGPGKRQAVDASVEFHPSDKTVRKRDVSANRIVTVDEGASTVKDEDMKE
ncbi:MAG: hypothetical protein ACE15C_17225 [Phycisphaerae bacterium]